MATAPALKTFHATMAVTRLEEWCVDAETVEAAKAIEGGHGTLILAVIGHQGRRRIC